MLCIDGAASFKVVLSISIWIGELFCLFCFPIRMAGEAYGGYGHRDTCAILLRYQHDIFIA